jgi:hypothetical protein
VATTVSREQATLPALQKCEMYQVDTVSNSYCKQPNTLEGMRTHPNLPCTVHHTPCTATVMANRAKAAHTTAAAGVML